MSRGRAGLRAHSANSYCAGCWVRVLGAAERREKWQQRRNVRGWRGRASDRRPSLRTSARALAKDRTERSCGRGREEGLDSG